MISVGTHKDTHIHTHIHTDTHRYTYIYNILFDYVYTIHIAARLRDAIDKIKSEYGKGKGSLKPKLQTPGPSNAGDSGYGADVRPKTTKPTAKSTQKITIMY